ncbi:tetratricopeptide repeat protein [bacterium]|nr:tetratricopeptide repeat protein [bacterium]MBP9809588.1 tetratricopeptide repeat protein [bacterium]
MKRELPRFVVYLLAGAALAFGTADGAGASGGYKTRLYLVPPAVDTEVSAGSSVTTNSTQKTAAQKKTKKIDEAISLYRASSIAKAVPLFQQILLAEPTNAQAHYYYANCLAREGQNSAARFEYQSSLRYSNNTELKNYCSQALKNLDAVAARKASGDSLAIDSTSAKADDLAKQTTVHSSNGQTRAVHFDQQLERLRAEVSKEYHHKLDEKRAELNRKISKIEQERDAEINATPAYFPAHISSPNINYKSTVDGIKTKAEYKVKILTADYQEEFRLIDETYGKRLDSLASSHQNLKGQMGATVGSSQVTPAGTSFYVRNYVNFGGVQTGVETGSIGASAFSPGLKAVPGKLKPFAAGNGHR